jgi:hypothetical protein
MKSFIISLVVLTLSFNISAQIITKEISIENFSTVEIEGFFNVNLSNSSSPLKMVGESEDIQWVKVENQNGKLQISVDKNQRKIWKRIWGNKSKIDLFIGVPNIKALKVEGIGQLKTLSPIKSEELNININGVSHSEMAINVRKVKIEVNGIGDFMFRGGAESADIDFSGIGNFNSLNLDVVNLKINGSGIGNCEVRASNQLEINSSGIGNISYAGSPEHCLINKTGIGSVSRK